ncbi:hypothetical protein Hanom_Chr13g01198351 [Helianthus anomalus]
MRTGSYTNSVWYETYQFEIRAILGEFCDYDVDNSWQSVMIWMEQNASLKKTEHIIGKLVIAATTYFIWLERNNCLFSNTNADVNTVIERIKSTVRLRLLGFKFKRESNNESLLNVEDRSERCCQGSGLAVCFVGLCCWIVFLVS